MISMLLDLLAPRARSNLEVCAESAFAEIIENFEHKHELKRQGQGFAKFRVDGDFFSDLKATQVLIGKEADPKHYSKVGFDLIVICSEGKVWFKAEERVILGYFETKAVAQALLQQLRELAKNYI